MELKQFLESSPLARKIKLESRVVIHRSRLNSDELNTIIQQGSFTPATGKELAFELEAAGKVLAQGKIIKKHGEYFFKVTGLTKGEK